MPPRLRSNYAWLLRGIAKALSDHANRVDPIKLRPLLTKPAEGAWLLNRANKDVVDRARMH